MPRKRHHDPFAVPKPQLAEYLGPRLREDGSVFLGERCGGCNGSGERHWPPRVALIRHQAKGPCPSCDGDGFIGTEPGTDFWSPYGA